MRSRGANRRRWPQAKPRDGWEDLMALLPDKRLSGILEAPRRNRRDRLEEAARREDQRRRRQAGERR